ncbi:MAG: hypothetical protein GF334_02110 [Candidatus Altiarchaeales archaeon]|nr:hypothetical protein [Candidatus Altiarchaeales archaeon]
MSRLRDAPSTYAKYLMLVEDVDFLYFQMSSTKLKRLRDYSALCGYLMSPLEEMPPLLGDASPILRAMAQWRLEIGK